MRTRAREPRARGHDIRSVARSPSLPYKTGWHWCVDRPERAVVGTAKRCYRCSPEVDNPTRPDAYAYLLGLYLGDGHPVPKKHERAIVLAGWQREIVAAHPDDFLRGLFHSDGRRATNRVTVRGKEYVYPRYTFGNESADVMGLCQWALDLLGVAWRMCRPDLLSVARREAVAALDRHVGPKS
ncbi:transcriptional regulator [Micromonospora sp. CA-111912]|uniref:transcriptional regulator n=1 Tax=Micromonospora sp. CA-111912 TaxID=3239955 RepID=UPI003D8B054A